MNRTDSQVHFEASAKQKLALKIFLSVYTVFAVFATLWLVGQCLAPLFEQPIRLSLYVNPEFSQIAINIEEKRYMEALKQLELTQPRTTTSEGEKQFLMGLCHQALSDFSKSAEEFELAQRYSSDELLIQHASTGAWAAKHRISFLLNQECDFPSVVIAPPLQPTGGH